MITSIFLKLCERAFIMIKAIQIQHDNRLKKALTLAKKAGYEYVSIGFGSSTLFHSDGWEKEIEEIKRLLDTLGLKCTLTHLPYHDLTLNSNVVDEVMDEAIKRAIISTAMLGADRTVHHTRTFYLGPGAADNARSKADNITAIRKLIPTAKNAGVILALENLPKFKKYPLYPNNQDELLDLFYELDDPNLGICWDFGHGLMSDNDQAQALLKIGKNLKVTHIHDNFKNDDLHLIPGIGVTDWKALMPILKNIGYDGPLMLELVYPDDSTLESFLKYSYASVERLEALMGE